MKSVVNSLLNAVGKNKFVSSALKNKYVLYIVSALAILNVFGYLALYEYRSLLFFVFLAILTSLYSKNMIVVLAVAVLGTNLLFAGYSQKRFYVVEGFTSDASGNEAFATEEKEEFENEEEKETESDAFTQKNVPDSMPARVNQSAEDRIGKRVDYASTVEKAYDNLENILGGSGMKNLTADTQKLIKQQKTLMGTLQQMKPLISMAKESMNSMNPKEMETQMEQAKKMLQTFQNKE